MPDGSTTPSGSDRALRLTAAGVALAIAAMSMVLRHSINPRLQGLLGVVCFIAIVAAFSRDLRAVSWRTVAWGMALQLGLALFILKLEIGGVRPGYAFFSRVGDAVKQFLEFTNAGSQFVFGVLADQPAMDKVFGPGRGFVFAFTALPTIIFVSSFFTVLYYFGVLQLIVRVFARLMMFAMRTSGAETLSAVANVFMGQTEAPIIVKPYVPSMTQSELLALMVGGMATISGGVMAVYITLGADPVAILTTSVMAAPCGLYLSKILYPETEEPVTRGEVKVVVERPHTNVIDAAAAGASDGTLLAINVAAMLIAFLAFIALFDYLLAAIHPQLSLARVFAVLFAPVAVLMGVPAADVPAVGDLLGTKLVANEFVAYIKLTTEYRGVISDRSYTLATYALTGFANFASIGIQLGGIGAMAPTRRGDLARLGSRALLAGFIATLINAAIAAALL
ncbi:MAG TPA: nucleoside transporter C-terminal domain-containing protein [Vicinamibacterales bacterium]|jgi:CNT family concentrative nucleoside transporter|nr:nucleoside transporter C-terminal domain-containing protein [Vicinamibacterales bacterium]